MSLDQHVIERTAYTLFDMLGDVGGLSVVLSYLAFTINCVFNYQSSENFLVSQLFTTTASEDFPEVKG